MKDEGMVPISFFSEILTHKAIPSHILLLSFRIRQLLSYGNETFKYSTQSKIKANTNRIALKTSDKENFSRPVFYTGIV